MSYPQLPGGLLAIEEQMLATWREEELFQRTLAENSGGEPFVFFEGPPTANGRPGLHHVLSRAIKDLVCRHRAMQGRAVTRIAGWDTHGLPVEIEAEKKLGISGKPEIEALGIAEFNQACRDSVFTYKEEFEQLSERIGYWLEYWQPYVTLDPDYIESVWWLLKTFADRGLLYRGHKSVPYCPRCGTTLSSHEVALGYKDVEDPSLVFVAEVLTEDGGPDAEGRAFLAWTTTPWTVPSNTGLAVNAGLEYAEVDSGGRRYIVAEGRVEALFGEDAKVVAKRPGADFVGWRYRRPLDVVAMPEEPGNGWTVVAEDFVSASDGTGIVHMAPAFGADDYAAGQRHGLPLLNPLDSAGHFESDVDLVGGMFAKDADPLLVDALREKGLLFDIGTVLHSYPHCWRCSSPLLYMARDTWFAATSTLKGELLANNEQINWHPPEVGEGRFGEWLRGNVDWALSRDRYWGTPIPVWVCENDADHVQWIGSLEELGAAAGGLPEDFDPHRPHIDALEWACSECAGIMRRTPEVLDAWFDSGAMPYAQWHYPFEHEDDFQAHFPADFICEGIDQTRGWFYSLLAISTLLGHKVPPYRNVLVNDMILDAEGQKMSKSKGNVADPWEAIGDHGADAVRWYMITSSNPWLPKRYDPEAVREAARRFFDTLFNTYRFFVLYAEAEAWAPSDEDPTPAERPLMDRWLLSRLSGVVAQVSSDLEEYQLTRAYRLLGDFVVEDLSNWYVRRSRSRFWGNVDAADTRAAFRTLWEALRQVAVLAAPCIPFAADWLHRALTESSVHLQRWPAGHDEGIDGVRDEGLEADMAAARVLVSLGRAAREEAKVRVRQPLRTLQAVLPGGRPLGDDVLEVVREELNVKAVTFLSSTQGIVTLVARPNYRALGVRFRKETNDAAGAIRALPQEALQRHLSGEPVEFEVSGTAHVLEGDDVEVVQEASTGLLVKAEGAYAVALDAELDDELVAEGLARELVNRIQRLRKDAGLDITDRVDLTIGGPPAIVDAATQHRDFIGGETLALAVIVGEGGANGDFPHVREIDIDGTPATIGLRRSDA